MISGISHVEFFAANGLATAHMWTSGFAFSSLFANAPPPPQKQQQQQQQQQQQNQHYYNDIWAAITPDVHLSVKTVTTRKLQSGTATILVTSSSSLPCVRSSIAHGGAEEEEEEEFGDVVREWVIRHGDGIGCVGFFSSDVVSDVLAAQKAGCRVHRIGESRCLLKVPFADLFHELVPAECAKDGKTAPEQASEWNRKPWSFLNIDHLALAIPSASMTSVSLFYESAFGFTRFLCSDDDKMEEGLVVDSQSGRTAGLRTKAIAAAGGAKLVLVEPLDDSRKQRSQIQEFIDCFGGPGVAHAALQTDSVVEAVGYMRSQGIPFVDVPHAYYGYSTIHSSFPPFYRNAAPANAHAAAGANEDESESECACVGDDDTECFLKSRYDLLLRLLKSHKAVQDVYRERIMVDGNRSGVLLQTFSLPLSDRPTFYIEVIERRNGADGFGKGNISSLFDAIEREQAKRER
eukprot:ANDGO_03458.mRNA.1 4-hydroxyphenylpyruvate dioxygenase